MTDRQLDGEGLSFTARVPPPDPGAVAERTMGHQETRILVSGVGFSLSNLAMEEFVMGDHARLVASMQLAMELAASSRLFTNLYGLFDSDATFRDALARVRGGPDTNRLHVMAYGLGGMQYSWAPRFRLAILLLLRAAFPDVISDVEVVCPTVALVERRAMEELGCVVTTSVQQCQQVHEPTLIFMPYADHIFFKNLLTLNWSADQLGKIILLGHSFGAMVKMLELSLSKQEKFGVTEQIGKVRKLLAIKEYVNEIELCSELDGLLHGPLWGDDCPYDELANEFGDSQEQCGCMHCVANVERYAMIGALPSSFSVHLFHLDTEIGMDHLVLDNRTIRVWSTVNIEMNYDAQLTGWHLNSSDTYIEDKDLMEAASIVKEVYETMLDVRRCSLYTKFIDQLKENPSIGDCISRMLGSDEYMTLLIYGLGSFEFDVKSQYQLAFALLLKEDNIFPIGDIEIYDPALSPADVKSCFDMGIKVLLVNEQCQRRVEKPTIFYVPGLKFVGNIVEANLSPKHLNKMILVSYGFKYDGESISGEFENWNCGCTRIMGSLSLERERFLWAIKDCIHEVISLEKSDRELVGVSELKFEFLKVEDDTDIYSKLPSLTLKEKIHLNFKLELEYNSFLAFDHVASLRMQLEERISQPFREDQCVFRGDVTPFWGHVFRHRLPVMRRVTWSPPPKGWVKLNFHGIGCSKGTPACIGGILHNDKGEVLSYYAGPVGDVDEIVASARALDMGLQTMIDLNEPVFKLIVEGDNLMVIRWCNIISRPPERAYDLFSRISWCMNLRPFETPAPDELPTECNKGEDEGDDSKDADYDNGLKDDDQEGGGASSKSVIPLGWTRREYIAWQVEDGANQVTIRLARVGASLPGIFIHQSTMCDCGNGMDMKNDEPDDSWFLCGFDTGDDIITRLT